MDSNNDSIKWNDANGKAWSVSLIGDHMKNEKSFVKEIGSFLGEQQAKDLFGHYQKSILNGQNGKSINK